MSFDYESQRRSLEELTKRVEKLEEYFGLQPATALEILEQRISKLEKGIEAGNENTHE